MDQGRRKFLRNTAVAGSALVLPVPIGGARDVVSRQTENEIQRISDSSSLKILILGGTSFIGPHLINVALKRGHEISIFTRGRTTPTVYADLLDNVERLIGDRDGDLRALEGRSWDVVIDNSGYEVKWTKDSANLLKDHVALYIYTSSTGVYYPYVDPPISESRKLVSVVPDRLSREERLEYEYGVMKTLSEVEVRNAFGDDRTTVIRPTYIMGPGDRRNRFLFWPVRLQTGGEVMLPGKPDDPVQWIDVRDLAGFYIRLAERGVTGTYTAAGPASRMGMHAYVHGVHATSSSPVEWVSIPDYDFLQRLTVPYILPWILPEGNNLGSARAVNDLAISVGLTFKPLADTVLAVLNWWESDAISNERRDSLTEPRDSMFQRERGIIRTWRSR